MVWIHKPTCEVVSARPRKGAVRGRDEAGESTTAREPPSRLCPPLRQPLLSKVFLCLQVCGAPASPMHRFTAFKMNRGSS